MQNTPIKDIVVLVKCCINQASSRPEHKAPLLPMCAHTEKYNAAHTYHTAEAIEAEIAFPADHGGGNSRQPHHTVSSSHKS